MPRINIIFHTVSGNTFRLAEAIAIGVSDIARCEPQLPSIEEPNAGQSVTMPGLEERHHDSSQVKTATVQDLVDCDGLALGTPVYWGGMSYATKYFIESAASL